MRFSLLTFGRTLARTAVVIALWGMTPRSIAGTLIEKTLAFVNKTPVLLSDVQLTKALLGLDAGPALERTIDERLMFEEARRLINEALSEKAIAAAVDSLRTKAGPGFVREALVRKARVQLTISNYIDVRLAPLVRVEDSEVRSVFNGMVADQQAPPSFDAVAKEIRAALERKSLDQKVEDWVATLRARAEIRR